MSLTPDYQPQDTTEGKTSEDEPKEWTLMFYFASDNPLAPAIVSQLKAIKDAGFHKQVHVVARFDPHTKKTPSHIFDVNLINKLKADNVCHVGFTANDPYVRTLVPDRLWADEVDAQGQRIRDRLQSVLNEELKAKGKQYDPPIPPVEIDEELLKKVDAERFSATAQWFSQPEINQPINEPSPKHSLKSFLEFCASNYKARRYILFILGHGIVVGNDLFLFDEFAEEHSLTLKDLGDILKNFVNVDLKQAGGELELISFHSCSMSGLEVAYELKDTAKYMLASEGPAFVGSFPYRQILIRIFNDVENLRKNGEPIDVEYTVNRIFDYCFYNSYDFQLAGYSYDCALTDLRCLKNDGDDGIKSALKELSDALMSGMTKAEDSNAQTVFGPASKTPDTTKDAKVAETDVRKVEALARAVRNQIILSHLEAQAYYEENFTDLLDFCFCLERRCEDMETLFGDQTPSVVSRMKGACEKMMDALKNYRYQPQDEEDVDNDAGKDVEDKRAVAGNPDKGDEVDNKPKPILRSGFAGPAYQYSHGLSIYFPWSRPVGSKMWNHEYEEYALMHDTDHSWMNFLDRYFDATMRLTQADEKTGKMRVPKLNSDAELLEDISGLVFNEYGQLKDDPEDKAGGPGGGPCVCPSWKNYPPITRKASVPVSRFLLKDIMFR